jgi:16S rRNA (cytosine967-C5)-methyltransferase
MKAIHQLATVEQILAHYQQDQPLHRFLAIYYRQHKQMGSKDRKIASRLVYNYFRLGHALKQETLLNRLIVAEFLCNNLTNSFIAFYKPDWETAIHLNLEEKFSLVKEEFPTFDILDIFPFYQHLSATVNIPAFCSKILVQPDLYIRVRKGAEKRFTGTLIDAGINFQHLGEQTYSLANGTKLDHLFSDKGLYEVQDLSSQQVGQYFKPQKWDKWWDCCAASGGKSLLLHQQEPNLKLLVSDVRASILDNLDERFLHAGIKSYQKKVLDLTLDQSLFLHDYEFDGIILDAPCSGSGTWGRTPEMISQFQEHTIQFFQDLQRKIIRNVIPYLKAGKPLIYITCSVFKEENEAQITWMKEEFKLQVESQELIKGYEHKADTMFVSRLFK